LDDETTYYFVVRAFGTSGNGSPDSDEACYQSAEKNDPLTQGDALLLKEMILLALERTL
jgi:hypothetical protein